MQMSALKQLRQEMEQLQLSWQLDGYGLFVYCVELRRLHLPELAIPALCEAVRLKPAHWGVWLELSCLVSSRDRLPASTCRTTGASRSSLPTPTSSSSRMSRPSRYTTGSAPRVLGRAPTSWHRCETLFYYRNSLSHVLRLTHACYYLVIGGHRVPQHEAGGGGSHLLQAAERGGPLQA